MMDETVYPDVVRALEERRELMRLAAQSALDRSRNGQSLDPEARSWAQQWAAIKPLMRPFLTGEPA